MFVSDSENAFLRFENCLFMICFCLVMIAFFSRSGVNLRESFNWVWFKVDFGFNQVF